MKQLKFFDVAKEDWEFLKTYQWARKEYSKWIALYEELLKIKLENEINSEADEKVKDFNNKLEEIEGAIKIEVDKVTPIREKNIENLSKIQRLNLELKSLDEENERIKVEYEV